MSKETTNDIVKHDGKSQQSSEEKESPWEGSTLRTWRARLTSFSGVSMKVLGEYYIEWNKYLNIGASVLFTGIWSGTAAGFAISYVFPDQLWIAVVFAVFWGLMIINLDMLIVGTFIKYKGDFWRQAAAVGIRVLLAAVIAFTIAVPIEMELFKDEIKTKADEIRMQRFEAFEAKLDSLPDVLALKQLQLARTAAQIRFENEMQGAPGTSERRGIGPIAEQIQQEVNRIDTNMAYLNVQVDSTVSQLRRSFLENNPMATTNADYGFLIRYKAFAQLKAEPDKHVLYIAWFISLLFLLVEILPILGKAIQRRGPYDSGVAMEATLANRANDDRI
jgi:hypothetical protein